MRWERVRAQMTAGLRREAKDPDALAGRGWRESAFPNHPYGLPVRGTLESLGEIGRTDLGEIYRACVVRRDLKIAAVGAIDAVKLGEVLDQAFGGLSAHGTLVPVPDVAVASGGTPQIIDLDIPQSTIRFGLNGVPRRDPDHMAAVVINHILGGGVFSAPTVPGSAGKSGASPIRSIRTCRPSTMRRSSAAARRRRTSGRRNPWR